MTNQRRFTQFLHDGIQTMSICGLRNRGASGATVKTRPNSQWGRGREFEPVSSQKFLHHTDELQ